MPRFSFPRILLLITLLAVPTQVWSQVDTRRSVSFGDSLTDNDNLFLLFGTDPAIYGSDPFEAVFSRASGLDDNLMNYAILASTSADVLDQVLAYTESRLIGDLAPASLISLQAGGNDFLTTDVLLTLASATPGESDSADRIVNQIRRNLFKSLLLLRLSNPRASVVVWTVPDVTLTPYVLSLGLDAQSLHNISLHIHRLNRSIRNLKRMRHVAVLDVSKVLSEVSIAPPIIGGITLSSPPLFGFGAAVFADPIHPTAVSNGLLANEMITSINEAFDDQIPLYSEAELFELIGQMP